jgi:hypothetical protein
MLDECSVQLVKVKENKKGREDGSKTGRKYTGANFSF